MATPARLARQKISTTISSVTLSYLQQSIQKSQARTLAEAIDLAVQRLQVYENRERLANDTSAYFEQLSPEAAEEESKLGTALANSVHGIDFDREP